MKKKILSILAEGFEEVEAITPVDLLRRAGVEVDIASANGNLQVKGSHGITVVADLPLESIEKDYDGVVLHGGSPGAENLAASPVVWSTLMEFNKKNKIIAAICASPAIVLTPTGILKDKKACVFPGLEKKFDPSTKVSFEQVTVDVNIITSRGLGTAHAFGLKILEILLGKDQRDKIAKATLFED